jgi:membrane-bound metal-dependent hydrolase YbcI (DUF457 family)
MFLGAVAQSVPDIDFIASFWTSTSENLLAHRGFTHSILFTLLMDAFFWCAGTYSFVIGWNECVWGGLV